MKCILFIAASGSSFSADPLFTKVGLLPARLLSLLCDHTILDSFVLSDAKERIRDRRRRKKSIFRVVQPFFEHSLARVCFSLGSKGILNLSDLKLYTLVRPRACAFCLGFFTCILEAHSSSRTVFCLLRCFSELVMLLYPAWQGSGSKLSRHGHNWVSTYTNLLPPSFS